MHQLNMNGYTRDRGKPLPNRYVGRVAIFLFFSFVFFATYRSNFSVGLPDHGYSTNHTTHRLVEGYAKDTKGLLRISYFRLPVPFISDSVSLFRLTCVSITADIEGQLWIFIPLAFSISEPLESGSGSLYGYTSRKHPQPCYMAIQARISPKDERGADYMAGFTLSDCSPIRDDHRSGFHCALKRTNPACCPGTSAST